MNIPIFSQLKTTHAIYGYCKYTKPLTRQNYVSFINRQIKLNNPYSNANHSKFISSYHQTNLLYHRLYSNLYNDNNDKIGLDDLIPNSKLLKKMTDKQWLNLAEVDSEDLDEIYIDNIKNNELKDILPSSDDTVRKKGGGKYIPKSYEHRQKLSEASKKVWRRRFSSDTYKMKQKMCSVCGKVGHNKQTCPENKNSDEKKERKPRTFEHRWRIGIANQKPKAKKLIPKQEPIKSSEEINENLKEDNLKMRKKPRCSYCQKKGHYKTTCPEYRKLKTLMIEKNKELKIKEEKKENKNKLVPIDQVKQVRVGSDVFDLEKIYTVPLQVNDIWEKSLECCIRAWKAGIRRQRLELMLPVLDNKKPSNIIGHLGGQGIHEQFRVAVPIVEKILAGLREQSNLEGQIEAKMLDENEAVGYWENDKMACLLFPQPQSIDNILALDVVSMNAQPRLLLMVNPQWQPGQIISDFGFGQLKKFREDFVNSFEDIFYMKQISLFNDNIILMRCYPSQWQVHFIRRSGEIELINLSPEKPNFETLLEVLKKTPDSMASLTWIERFPLVVDRQRLEKEFRSSQMSRNYSKMKEEEEEEIQKEEKVEKILQEYDIITGDRVDSSDSDSDSEKKLFE